MIQTKTTQPTILLTSEEIIWVFAKYPLCKTEIFDDARGKMYSVPDYLQGLDFEDNGVKCEKTTFDTSVVKLVLKNLTYIPDDEIFLACYACNSATYRPKDQKSWEIIREFDVIKVRHKTMNNSYQIDINNGNVHLFLDGRPSTLGSQANVIQFFYQHHYALPIYLGPKHPANDKTPFEVGIAVPSRKPIIGLLMMRHGMNSEQVTEWMNNKFFNGVDLNDIHVYHEVYRELLEPIK